MAAETFYADAAAQELTLPSGQRVSTQNPIEEFCRRQDPSISSKCVLADGDHPGVSIGDNKNRGYHDIGVRDCLFESENGDSRINGGQSLALHVWEKLGSVGQGELEWRGIDFWTDVARYAVERAEQQKRRTIGLDFTDCDFSCPVDARSVLTGLRTYETSSMITGCRFTNFKEHGVYQSSVPGNSSDAGVIGGSFENLGSAAIQLVDRVGMSNSDSKRHGDGPYRIEQNDIHDCADPKNQTNQNNTHQKGGSCIHVAGHPGRIVIKSNRVDSARCGAIVVWGDSGKGEPGFTGADGKDYFNRILVVDQNRINVDNGDRGLVMIASVYNVKWGRNGLGSNNKSPLDMPYKGGGGGVGKVTRWSMASIDAGWDGASNPRRREREMSDAEIDALYQTDGGSW